MLVALLAVAAQRIVSGGAPPPSLVPAEIVPGNAIKAGMPGAGGTRNP